MRGTDLDGTIAASASSWQEALNPPIYLVSLLPGLGVWLLAPAALQHPLGLALATIAVILVQHAINLFNDAADWRLGADVEKHDSWVRVHHGRPRTAARHGLISLLAGGLLGLGVLWQQGQWWILPIALPMVGLGYLYNAGRRPLSYTHLGEWVTGICYGPGVFGCLWLVAGLDPDIGMLAGSIAFGALAMALLLSHQPPQIETDRRAGKRSFAVRYGADRTVRVAQLLFVVFLACASATLMISAGWQVGLVGVLTAVTGGVWVISGAVNPRRVLLAASAFVMASLFASVGF